MTTETRSLHRKLAQVMYEAERIPKRGRAPAILGGYPFVEVGDAADFIRKALAEKVVTMMPTNIQAREPVDRPTKGGGTMTTVDLVVDWTITDGESGESIVIQSFGAGADGGDKYSGKAMTNAMKYAFLAGFLLSTGEDSELGSHEAAQRPAPAGFPEGTRPPVVEPNVETEELVGIIERGGTVRPGTANGYKLEARQGPNGHVIGFRLEIDGDKNIPQVVVEGPAGDALFLATSQNPESLIGHRIDVKGRLNQVRRPGTRGYYRLHVTEWKTKDYRYPAEELPARSVAPGGAGETRAAEAKREVIGAYMEGDNLTGDQVKPVLDALDKRAAGEPLDEPPDDLQLLGQKDPAA